VPWMFHLMAVHGCRRPRSLTRPTAAVFIGRGRTVVDPQAMQSGARLSDSQGSVLDPIVAIRQRITLDADASATINMVSGVGETRDGCLALVDKYQDRRLADRVFDLAWTHSQVALRQIQRQRSMHNCTDAWPGPSCTRTLRCAPTRMWSRRPPRAVWPVGLFHFWPICHRLAQDRDPANIALVRQLVQAHAYWRRRGLKVDLVIWNEDHSGYRQVLHDQIMGLIAAAGESKRHRSAGRIFVRPADQIADEDRILVQTVARVVLTDVRGDLASQIDQRSQAERVYPPPLPVSFGRVESAASSAHTVGPRPDLIFFNGLGGFTPDGREYVITTTPGRVTPAPWVNVLANPQFGTVLSESGAAYTWAENAHEFPFDPLGERPDQRRLRGSPVPARRGQWPVLVPDSPALSGITRPTHRRPPWLWL